MSPIFVRSSEIQRFKYTNMIKLHDEIMFVFYPELPHVEFAYSLDAVNWTVLVRHFDASCAADIKRSSHNGEPGTPRHRAHHGEGTFQGGLNEHKILCTSNRGFHVRELDYDWLGLCHAADFTSGACDTVGYEEYRA